jgi:hypothetical protein
MSDALGAAPRKVVGVTGRKGHGKDTVARMIANEGAAVVRFADPLKQMLRAYYAAHYVPNDTVERKIEGDLKEVPCEWLCGRSPRYAMQTLGTEWGRGQMHPDFWTQSYLNRVLRFSHVVTPDARFENEAEVIRRIGGKIVSVDASLRVPLNEFSHHSSEAGIPASYVDVVVDNNGTEAELKEKIRALELVRG